MHDLSVTQLRARIAAGDLTSGEAVGACLDRVEHVDGPLNAYLQTFPREAAARARAVDDRVRSEGADAVGPLAGVPVAVKDNICTDLGCTTCASRILERYESPYNATVVDRLRAAGAVIIGKTNMDEFAMGSSNEHSAFGPARNPWDTDRSPGGSSGGSAVAVAARTVPVALGSDTGGSIRQPAGLCGVVGVKPTYGRVSRYGLVAFASSLDQIGPITRTVEDAAVLMDVLCAHDPRDSTSARVETPDFVGTLDEPVENLRVGVPKEVRAQIDDADVERALDDAIAVFKGLGAEIVDVELPSIEYGIAAYYIVAPAEASSNLARYDGIRYGRRAEARAGESLEDLYARSRAEGFGPEVQRRIMLGTHALSSGYYDAYYNTALKARRAIKNDFDAAFKGVAQGKGVHAVLMPTTPEPAFRIGAKTDDPLSLYLQDVFTVSANLAGIPGISVPSAVCQRDGATLPIGMQLLCPAFADALMLRIARVFEREVAFDHRPALETAS